MPNRFIQHFTHNKDTLDIKNATVLALQDIYDSRKQWLVKNRGQRSLSWRGDFFGVKLFYKPDVTKNNLTIIDNLIRDLNQLDIIDFELEDGRALPVIKTAINALSDGESKELCKHIMTVLGPSRANSQSSMTDYPPKQAKEKNKIETDNIDDKMEIEVTPMMSSTLTLQIASDHFRDQFIKRKGYRDFNFNQPEISLEAPITEHVKWVFNHIYSLPYPTNPSFQPIDEAIARYYHGMQHVVRAMLYVPVFVNLYRQYGDSRACELTHEDVKLLMIATLFHDAAREDEGVDKWDAESGLTLFYYLRDVLKIDQDKAILLAEAIANKDTSETQNYHQLVIRTDGSAIWQSVSGRPKNIYATIIQNADCLDIIRARDTFEAEHLDFYKDIASKNDAALDHMAKLICEARSLIERHGDSRNRTQREIKALYENENVYQLTQRLIHENSTEYSLIMQLGKDLLPINTEDKISKEKIVSQTTTLTSEQLRKKINDGRVFSRGIALPSGVRLDKKHNNETLAHLELYKTYRRNGKKTRTVKRETALNKEGNPFRSVSMIGHGSGVFSDAGFLIIDYHLKQIKSISAIDHGTGRGKKKHLQHKIVAFTPEKKFQQLKALQQRLMKGGQTVKFSGINHVSTHVEILYDCTEYNAVYFSNDPNLINSDVFSDPYPVPHSPFLQAIYLQREFELMNHKKLPLVEYSGLHNKAEVIPDPTDEQIFLTWQALLTEQMNKFDTPFLCTASIEILKIRCTYRHGQEHKLVDHLTSLDSIYPDDLKKRINEEVNKVKTSILAAREKKLLANLADKKLDVVSPDALVHLHHNPNLIFTLHEKISKDLIDLYNELIVLPDRSLSEKYIVKGMLLDNVFVDEIDRSSGQNWDTLWNKINECYRLAKLANPTLSDKIKVLLREIILNAIREGKVLDILKNSNYFKDSSQRLFLAAQELDLTQQDNDLIAQTIITACQEILKQKQLFASDMHYVVSSLNFYKENNLKLYLALSGMINSSYINYIEANITTLSWEHLRVLLEGFNTKLLNVEEKNVQRLLLTWLENQNNMTPHTFTFDLLPKDEHFITEVLRLSINKFNLQFFFLPEFVNFVSIFLNNFPDYTMPESVKELLTTRLDEYIGRYKNGYKNLNATTVRSILENIENDLVKPKMPISEKFCKDLIAQLKIYQASVHKNDLIEVRGQFDKLIKDLESITVHQHLFRRLGF